MHTRGSESLDTCLQGLEDPDAVGADYNVDEEDNGPRPFTALLDTGLKRTSTGSKVFAALKVPRLLVLAFTPPLLSSKLSAPTSRHCSSILLIMCFELACWRAECRSLQRGLHRRVRWTAA